MDYFDQLETHLAELTTAGAHLRRRRGLKLRWPRSPLPALALGLSILVVAAVVMLALSARNSRPSPSPANQPAAAPISPALVRNYRLLRRPVRPSDALPSAFAHLGPGYGLMPRLARRVVLPGGRIEMWLEPGRTGFCVFMAERLPSDSARTSGGGGSCQPARALPVVGVVAANAATDEPELAHGIVPDHVTALALAPANGKPRQIRTTEGFFAVPYRTGDRIYWIRRDEAEQIFPPLPARGPGPKAATRPFKLFTSSLPNGSHFTLTIQPVRFRLGRYGCLSFTQELRQGSRISQSCVGPIPLSSQPVKALGTGPTICGAHPAQVVWGIVASGVDIEIWTPRRIQLAARRALPPRLRIHGDLFYALVRGFPYTVLARGSGGRGERTYPMDRRRVPRGCAGR